MLFWFFIIFQNVFFNIIKALRFFKMLFTVSMRFKLWSDWRLSILLVIQMFVFTLCNTNKIIAFLLILMVPQAGFYQLGCPGCISQLGIFKFIMQNTWTYSIFFILMVSHDGFVSLVVQASFPSLDYFKLLFKYI